MSDDRRIQVAVCGPGDATQAEETAAERTGQLLAKRGCVLICGGLGGVMAAACRGAKTGGGTTIGILPGSDHTAANPWVDHAICTGFGQARNAVVAATAEAVIAVGGGFGTLSEIALAVRLRRPVIVLGGWSATLDTSEGREMIALLGGNMEHVTSPDEAVEAALRAIQPK